MLLLHRLICVFCQFLLNCIFAHLVFLPVGFVLVVRGRRSQRNGRCSAHGGLAPRRLILAGGGAREPPVATSQRRQLLQDVKRRTLMLTKRWRTQKKVVHETGDVGGDKLTAARLRRVRMPCLLLTSSSSLTGLNMKAADLGRHPCLFS